MVAILASLAQDNPAALEIALVHLLFNVLGVSLFFCVPPLRKLPPYLAMRLARRSVENRLWVLGYVVGVFVVVPLAGWILWS